jgi:hypothetical protein
VIFKRGRRDQAGPQRPPAEDPVEASDPAAAGPYDVADAPAEGQWLDLGSLRVPAVDGVEIRLETDQEGSIAQVLLVHGRSVLQLAVLAAPRSEGIWDEVRADLRRSLENDGARVEEVDGGYGPELRARLRTPGGPATVRFVGVDGPRWMVQGVFQGPAATDPTAAAPLQACLTDLVVDRGKEAMPVRESLPLRLPSEVVAQANPEEAEA